MPDSNAQPSHTRPNVLIILADDLGYGDVACNNKDRGKIPTPNLDKLAAQGMRFTDAHSSSAVCSPTRYALLTGRYHWRTRLQSGIVANWEKPLIDPDRLTIASLAKKFNYQTAAIGKWHLGRDWPISEDQKWAFQGNGGQAGGGGTVKTQPTEEQKNVWRTVFAKPIPGGPTTRGFDYYFGTDVPNWPPYCFIENDRTVGIPTEFMPQSAFVKNQASLQGPGLPGWDLTRVLPAITDKTCEVIHKFSSANRPFLVYLPLTSPHTPIAVLPEWRGKSGLNAYADFVMQTDHSVGQVLKTLKDTGQEDNTLVIFTSDNGCASYAGAAELEAKNHYPSGPLRGYKMDAFEGGHRVPFIVRWPGVIKPGTTSSATIGSIDIMATLAEILGFNLPENAGEDSFSLLPVLKGQSEKVRSSLVHQSVSGIFALRQGDWKIIFGPGTGQPDKSKINLFDVGSDLGEKNNLASENPEKVQELTLLMQEIIQKGRTTPGPAQQNDARIVLFKTSPNAKTKAKAKAKTKASP